MLGARGHAKAAGDGADFHAALGGVVVGDELVDGGADAGANRLVVERGLTLGGRDLFRGRFLYNAGDLLDRRRVFGGVDDGFDFGFQAHIH